MAQVVEHGDDLHAIGMGGVDERLDLVFGIAFSPPGQLREGVVLEYPQNSRTTWVYFINPAMRIAFSMSDSLLSGKIHR